MSSSDPTTWLDLATSDAVAARRLLLPPASLPQAAYLAQQAAEKAIKARLVDLRISHPRQGGRGHDLVALADLVPNADPLKARYAAISAITPWATAFRYPSDDPATQARVTVQEIEERLTQIEETIRYLQTALRDRARPA
ncbi:MULTISPECIES: HEPN domain-containing protein [Rhodopseudomonas]|uniref:HEPN domain-containing protein n=1 Tax=Rhodopseudomonas TaxID=1073 RepID=UPI000696A087|nr:MULTISPECIES: HEPN domain-containing protein [Rhodopseudomonas]MDF3812043.1 HEPN domain-containing protein [Rhodopseudomonas sp. BAL398]WOK16097.1 HEPN domain-containing protein [Rhodopseudomonas sp. BAL398]